MVHRVIALGARVGLIILIAAVSGTVGRSVEGPAAFTAAFAAGAFSDHPHRIRRAVIEGVFAGGAASAIRWMVINAIIPAWPEVLHFSASWTYMFLLTVFFGVLAIVDLRPAAGIRL